VIRPSAQAKRIKLHSVIEGHPAIVFGDANRLQQIIWNLLSNAVKFTNEGGSVEAWLRSFGGQIEISISDTGIGIEPEFQPYIFDRFRQADSTSTRRYGGLGLGLAIVRYLTEMHGGSVSVSSAGVDKGSTFKVRFPAAAPHLQRRPKASQTDLQPERHGASPKPAHHRLDGVRVLIVEDDPDTLDMLKVILDNSGAEAITAASTKEALQVLERTHPDALVSDLAMPDRDGYDLISEVRSRDHQHGGDIPAIALSAYTRAEDRTRAIAAGFQMHIPKPIDPDKLIGVLMTLTGSH
jgi:CheY-like chemotaxis protein